MSQSLTTHDVDLGFRIVNSPFAVREHLYKTRSEEAKPCESLFRRKHLSMLNLAKLCFLSPSLRNMPIFFPKLGLF